MYRARYWAALQDLLLQADFCIATDDAAAEIKVKGSSSFLEVIFFFFSF